MEVDGDLIITVQKGSDGALCSPKMRVYCKDSDGTPQQVGLIQEFEMKALADDYRVSVRAKLAKKIPGWSEIVLASITKNSNLLTRAGVTLDLCTCEMSGESLGVDQKCPVHGKKE